MLNLLFKLQNLESEERYWREKQKNTSLLGQLRELKSAYQQQSAKYVQLEGNNKNLEAELKHQRSQAMQIREQLAKEERELYEGAMNNAKIIAAKEQQIKGLSQKIGALEEEIIKNAEDLRCRQMEASHLYDVLSKTAAEFEAIKENYLAEKNTLEEKQAVLAKEKAELLSRIDKLWLDWYYSRIWDYAGFPVARLERGNTCSRCHTMHTNNQARKITLQEIKDPSMLIFCEKCGRAMFYEEEE